jgi:hypothetical protein
VNATDERISQKQHELAGLAEEMERQCAAFVEDATATVLDWYPRKAEEVALEKHEVTSRLGTESVAELRRKVEELRRGEDDVRQLLADDKLWLHRKNRGQVYHFTGNAAPKILDAAVRLAAGRLAGVLEEYGYLPADHQDASAWREWDPTGSRHAANARPYYTGFFQWSAKMKAAIEAYKELLLKTEMARAELARLTAEKAREDAKRVWDGTA